MSFKTTSEISKKYSVDGINCVRSWGLLLNRWRKSGELVEGVDWKFALTETRGRRPIIYDETKVIALIKASSSSFAANVRIENGKLLAKV